ncbi:hypothetical protein A2Z67_03695 [Candidatus Woesebacteria bacterium RBG_13_36_22]|uniref:Pesticin C-terminal domain-containing protein n=1 Tax=Candidatus Woesebacteria bacterium RBG_13_36_22 TaxID=1802478 RepID=A0A1F7WZ22_9BACT|nr:MAG: hypothetical protein A2Z67_03695 [Candidatus Woesebacteria bacterium RBG_13_36_22]
MKISERAIKLMLDEEGLDQPSKWPGEESGISLGRGYDLGYEENFENDWKDYLTPDEIARLKTVVGLHGQSAKARAHEFTDIHITKEAADGVFKEKTLPEYERQTREAFPGFGGLPLDAQGALISLVYNRGASMDGDRRSEMRAIKDLVLKKDLKGIANKIREMKRLWPTNLGLQERRDAEADLVESCILASVVQPQLEEVRKIGVEKPQGTFRFIQLLVKLIFIIFKK